MGTKRAVNLSIDAELLDEAKSYGANLSAIFEKAVQSDLREKRREKWRSENAETIRSLNEWVEENGIPFSELRPW